jgi:tRNA pseudouridine38-40 synthase
LRYLIELSYKGTAYHGWQKQVGVVTVQSVLENCLSMLLNESISVIGSSRTDAGVHAKQQFAHFDCKRTIWCDELLNKLNMVLPYDIAVLHVNRVDDKFHARFSATCREYQYKIVSYKDVFASDLSYYYKKPLNLELMNQISLELLAVSNFKAFSKVKTNVQNYTCHINYAKWIHTDSSYVFYISANRFLRGMVRAIAGCLFNIGQGKLLREDFWAIVKSEDRRKVKFSLPSHGLFLSKVNY